MKKLSIYTTVLALVLTCLFFATTALAGRGGKGNGFPCGEHYNLNLISKKDGFTCPDDITYSGETSDRNVIFIPVDNTNTDAIQIQVESGKKKDMDTYTEFKVTDWCAVSGDSRASLVLPANQDGYAVYARAVSKLGENLNIEIFDPNLDFVKDENQNNLLELGLIGPDGATSFLNNTETIYRKKGGKANKAVDITQLFLWSGEICYFSDVNTATSYRCCQDIEPDGIYDDCVVLPDTGICPAGYAQLPVTCTPYENEWVFDIADFVSAFWKVDNNGVKVLQIRFYPLPLCNQ